MPKPRPYLSRLFLRWLKASRSRFLIPAPQVVRSDDNSIGFTFPGLAGNLAGYFSRRSGITVSVNFRGECWDLLGDFDTVEVRSAQGYFCRLCLPEYRAYYPSREAFWTEHCFETFLQWCNETLAPANWLALYDYDGITEACLLRDKSEDTLSDSVRRSKREMQAIDGRTIDDDPEKYTSRLIALRRSRQLTE